MLDTPARETIFVGLARISKAPIAGLALGKGIGGEICRNLEQPLVIRNQVQRQIFCGDNIRFANHIHYFGPRIAPAIDANGLSASTAASEHSDHQQRSSNFRSHACLRVPPGSVPLEAA